jgi:hypothetical protein
MRREIDYWRSMYEEATKPPALPPPPGLLERVRRWFIQRKVHLVGGALFILGSAVGSCFKGLTAERCHERVPQAAKAKKVGVAEAKR